MAIVEIESELGGYVNKCIEWESPCGHTNRFNIDYVPDAQVHWLEGVIIRQFEEIYELGRASKAKEIRKAHDAYMGTIAGVVMPVPDMTLIG